jgi:hypothetical protein
MFKLQARALLKKKNFSTIKKIINRFPFLFITFTRNRFVQEANYYRLCRKLKRHQIIIERLRMLVETQEI